MMSLCVSIANIEHLFPFLVVVNDKGEVAYVGKSMKKMAPHILEKQVFQNHFKILQPVFDAQKDQFDKLLSKMTVIQEQKTKARFMGQWIRPSRKPFYAFIGSLSVTDPAQLRDLGLNFNDFPIQDQIFDFLMLTQTQKRSISEAEIANQKLAYAHRIAIQASETKSQFLANMSHELRTPMNGVLGMASVLREGTELTTEQQEFVDNIIQSGEAMLSLINDILDLTKVEAGFIQMEIQDFLISDLLDEVMNVVKVSAQKKGNTINYEIDQSVRCLVQTDRLRLRQVLLNIVGNANKFTKEGKISIQVNGVQDHPTFVRFSIIDTGPGMSEEVQAKIFNPFVQGDSSMTKQFGGTGLGLSISKKLVEALGGSIRCESKLGFGSKFEFEIEIESRNKQ